MWGETIGDRKQRKKQGKYTCVYLREEQWEDYHLAPDRMMKEALMEDMSLKVVVEVFGSRLEKSTDGKKAHQWKRMLWER